MDEFDPYRRRPQTLWRLLTEFGWEVLVFRLIGVFLIAYPLVRGFFIIHFFVAGIIMMLGPTVASLYFGASESQMRWEIRREIEERRRQREQGDPPEYS